VADLTPAERAHHDALAARALRRVADGLSAAAARALQRGDEASAVALDYAARGADDYAATYAPRHAIPYVLADRDAARDVRLRLARAYVRDVTGDDDAVPAAEDYQAPEDVAAALGRDFPEHPPAFLAAVRGACSDYAAEHPDEYPGLAPHPVRNFRDRHAAHIERRPAVAE
jgi:hypothetical protein